MQGIWAWCEQRYRQDITVQYHTPYTEIEEVLVQFNEYPIQSWLVPSQHLVMFESLTLQGQTGIFLRLLVKQKYHHHYTSIFSFTWISVATNTSDRMGACGLVGSTLYSRSKSSGVRFPLLVVRRRIGKTSHSILLLLTQQWWVHGGMKS